MVIKLFVTFLYFTGDKVLCKWRLIYYEAKILEVRHEIDEVQYYKVHYAKFASRLVYLWVNNYKVKFV